MSLADSPGHIDAHAHVWTSDVRNYPIAAGYRIQDMKPASFTPDDLLAHARPCGVSRVVLIQMSYYRFDNTYMLDAIGRHPGVFSGVGIVDPDRPDVMQQMRALKQRGVRGFRIQPRPDPETWMNAPGTEAMWRCGAEEGLAMCPLINPDALPAIDRLCGRFPDTPVVIDHFARIGADGEIRPSDLDRLCAISAHRKAHLKISAFYALGRKRPPYTDLLPMVRRLLDAFGPRRLMWGSDSPYQVQGLHSYEKSLQLIRDHLDKVSPADRRWLLGETAERVFFS